MSRFILVDIDFINLSFQFNKQTRRKDKNLIFFFFTNQPNYCYYWLIYIYINLKSFLKNFRNQKFVFSLLINFRILLKILKISKSHKISRI